MKIFALEIVV